MCTTLRSQSPPRARVRELRRCAAACSLCCSGLRPSASVTAACDAQLPAERAHYMRSAGAGMGLSFRTCSTGSASVEGFAAVSHE
eukprot:scaffold6706_cov119-Isochrysis_galbana.AAC.7